MNQEKQDQLIESYLLGNLSRQEREQIEVRYFADPDFLERMDAVEAELIEDYALGALGAEKAQKIKLHVLNSPYQLEKLRFAETLLNSMGESKTADVAVTEIEPPRKSWLAVLRVFFSPQSWPSFAIPAAAAVLVLVSGLIFEISRYREHGNLLREQTELKRQLQFQQETIAQQQKQIEQMTGKPQPSPEEKRNEAVKDQTPPPSTTHLATFMLLPVTTREVQEKPQDLPIPSNVTEVRLQLVYDGKRDSSYQAVLENADTEELWKKTGLKLARAGKQSLVNFDIPTKDLIENRTYIVTLTAKTASDYKGVSRYDFVAKRQ